MWSEKFLKLFHLGTGATFDDVKQAYRRLAKRNHPDRFTQEAEKKKQEQIMARLNEAYRALEAEWKESGLSGPEQETSKEESGADTRLYKEGVALFNRYSGSISLTKPQYTHFDEETVETKKAYLIQSQAVFKRLLEKYPDSDWAYDATERLKKIEKIMTHLTARDEKDSATLPRKDSDFYTRKFERMFRKS